MMPMFGHTVAYNVTHLDLSEPHFSGYGRVTAPPCSPAYSVEFVADAHRRTTAGRAFAPGDYTSYATDAGM
jgi:hypothetical protein